jgi:hypothetical protein
LGTTGLSRRHGHEREGGLEVVAVEVQRLTNLMELPEALGAPGLLLYTGERGQE